MSDPLADAIRTQLRRLAAASAVIRGRASFGLDEQPSPEELLAQQLACMPAVLRAVRERRFGIDA